MLSAIPCSLGWALSVLVCPINTATRTLSTPLLPLLHRLSVSHTHRRTHAGPFSFFPYYSLPYTLKHTTHISKCFFNVCHCERQHTHLPRTSFAVSLSGAWFLTPPTCGVCMFVCVYAFNACVTWK